MPASTRQTAEHARLADPTPAIVPQWRRWGCYVTERAWGTVREDYSAGGDAWSYLPHDQARSKAYRWGEDGIAGLCDRYQLLTFALALWNGRDPILKERMYGLTSSEGNRGEDVKDYYFYVDALPSGAYMKTESLETLLFQEKVRPNVGVEFGGGATYRPPLSDNIVLIGGVQAMALGQGLKDIYERDHLFAVFLNARFQF